MTAIGEQSLRWFSAAERVLAEPDLPALVRDHSGLLYRVALSILRNPAEAEDVVQDAFVRVLERRRQLAAIVEIRPWLVRIAWNPL
jgi:RNA polymerase sigma-70 factor (ECF subfamily)